VRYAVCQSVVESRLSPEITHALFSGARGALELGDYFRKSIERTYGSACNDAEACISNEANHRIARTGEPVSYSRIYYLV
jgi:hypothetical protein